LRRSATAVLVPYTTLFRSRSSMSGENTSIILICHSMGGQVGMCERSISGSKVIGLIGCGVPVDGSPLADRKAVYAECRNEVGELDRKSTRLNSSHVKISYA